jgi:DHA1 family multidrug resistance protein-like MFS transporter
VNQTNRRNILILFFTMVVVMMGFGLAIPILPFYVDYFGAGGTELGLLMATYSTMQFFFAPVWGSLSDRYGRKSFLMLGIVGNAISQVLFGLATQLWMLYAARSLSGILSSATLPTAMAYIGDSTAEEDRGGGMGVIGAAMGVGMVIGPGLGGLLARRSLALPFFIAAGLSTLALVFIFAALPESLPHEKRDAGAGDIRGPQLGQMWRALSGPIGILLVLSFLLSFGVTNFESVFGLFGKDRHGYDTLQVGIILMAIGVVSAVVQGMLTGPATRRFGEVAVVRASLIGSAVGFALMLLPDSFVGVMATACFFIISNAMLRPGVASLVSRRAPGGQGVAMGLHNAFMSLGRIFGPVWAGSAFDLNLSYPYLSGAAVMLLGFFVSLVWLARSAPAPVEASGPAP